MSSLVPRPNQHCYECESSSDGELSDDVCCSSNVPNRGSGCWCVTTMDILTLDFVWTIKDFVRYVDVFENSLTSSTFSSVEDDDTKWCLKLYPKAKGTDDESDDETDDETEGEAEDNVSVYLKLVSSRKNVVCARFSIAIVNKNNEKVNEKQIVGPCSFSPTQVWGFDNFISRKELFYSAKEMLPRGHLSLKCEIQMNRGSYNIFGVANKFNIPKIELLDDFHSLIEGKKYTDVILKVDGHEFKAHKAVLAARSEKFVELLDGHETEECPIIKITDIRREVFHETLLFLYTGNAPNVESLAEELIVVADRFDLSRLKALSEEVLFSQLTVMNASDTLILANLYDGQQLRMHTLQFMKTNSDAVLKTPGWAKLRRNYPHMIPEDIFPSETWETARERRLRLRNQARK